MKKLLHSAIIIIIILLLTACSQEIAPSNTPIPEVSTPTPQTPLIAPTQTTENPTVESFSSDELGLCFSYPPGYTLLPESEIVEVVAPQLPDTDLRAIFWLEISDAYDRSAELIADQDLVMAGVTVERWNITIGNEPAVVLDGMPGQDLQRRVYVVHGQKLYVLAFMPTLSETSAANNQTDALFTAISRSWKWSVCSTSE